MQQRTWCSTSFQTGPSTGYSAGSSGCCSDGKCCPPHPLAAPVGPALALDTPPGTVQVEVRPGNRSRGQAHGVTTQPPGFSSAACGPCTSTMAGHGCWGGHVLGTLPTMAGEGVSSEEPRSAPDAPTGKTPKATWRHSWAGVATVPAEAPAWLAILLAADALGETDGPRGE